MSSFISFWEHFPKLSYHQEFQFWYKRVIPAHLTYAIYNTSNSTIIFCRRKIGAEILQWIAFSIVSFCNSLPWFCKVKTALSYIVPIILLHCSHYNVVTISVKKNENWKIIFFEWSNSARKSIQIFWAQTFPTQSLPGPNFFKPSVSGDLRVFRAFASLFTNQHHHRHWISANYVCKTRGGQRSFGVIVKIHLVFRPWVSLMFSHFVAFQNVSGKKNATLLAICFYRSNDRKSDSCCKWELQCGRSLSFHNTLMTNIPSL